MLLESANGIEAKCEVVTSGHGEAEWEQVDRRLREYTHHRSALDAAELFDLVRAEQMRLHVVFGYVTLYEYMERVLGYGPHAARERMRVARALVALPETSTALARGALTYSAVRELTRVALPETETAWLAAAEGLVANQIERLVAEHRPGDRPDDPADPDRFRSCLQAIRASRLLPCQPGAGRRSRKVLRRDHRGSRSSPQVDLGLDYLTSERSLQT